MVGENLPETRGRKVKARIATRGREAFASTAKFHSGWSLSLVSSFALLMAIFDAPGQIFEERRYFLSTFPHRLNSKDLSRKRRSLLMKQKFDWKRITLLRKTSLQERDRKYWPLINGYPEVIQIATWGSVSTSRQVVRKSNTDELSLDASGDERRTLGKTVKAHVPNLSWIEQL